VIPQGQPRPALTRARKLAFAALTTALLSISIEGTARAYSALRFRNTQALTYGTRFLKAVLNGGVSSPVGSAEPRPVLDASTEELFASRATSTLRVAVREPMDLTLDGQPAHFNNLGLRGRDIDLGDAHRQRIGVFGGSDSFGAFLADRETWPAQLETRLQANGLAADVLNAAVNGHTIDGVLRAIMALTRTLKLDYLVVTSAYNNRHLLPMERRYTLARRMDWYLYNVSLFHVMLKEKLALLQRQPIDYGLYRQKIRVNAVNVHAWAAMYDRRLAQIATVAREHGATLVLCSQGELFQDARLNALNPLDEAAVSEIGRRIDRGEDVWLSELEYFLQGTQNLAVKRVAESSGDVLFFDGAAVLQHDKTMYFLDPIHPGPLGAARLAEALTTFFTPLLSAGGAAGREGEAKVRRPS
jgi:lysophospholipase L1-like esterase